MASEKLTKTEIQKQMYLEIKEIKDKIEKCDKDIAEIKEFKKMDKMDIALNVFKAVGIFAATAGVAFGVFLGAGALAIKFIPEGFVRALAAVLPASVALGIGVSFLDDPIAELRWSKDDVARHKSELKELEKQKQPLVQKLNMLESMNEEEAKNYVKSKLSEDKSAVESFLYYHNKKNAKKEQQAQTKPSKSAKSSEHNAEDNNER